MSPIVYLNKDQNYGNTSKLNDIGQRRPKITPSFYRQELEVKEQRFNEVEKVSQDYHRLKNQEFKYDGATRNINMEDPQYKKTLYLKTTFPQAEFNEDYIYVEKMTDHRLKTSSVSKRLYFNAPSINEIRKNGQHNFLLNALEKKKTYDEMIEKLNLMITSELCDPLNKMLKV